MGTLKNNELLIQRGAMLACRLIGYNAGGASHSFKFVNLPSSDEIGFITNDRPFVVITGKDSLDIFLATISGNIRKISGDGSMTYDSNTKTFTVSVGGNWWATCEVWGDSHLLQYIE